MPTPPRVPHGRTVMRPGRGLPARLLLHGCIPFDVVYGRWAARVRRDRRGARAACDGRRDGDGRWRGGGGVSMCVQELFSLLRLWAVGCVECTRLFGQRCLGIQIEDRAWVRVRVTLCLHGAANLNWAILSRRNLQSTHLPPYVCKLSIGDRHPTGLLGKVRVRVRLGGRERQ